MDLVDRGGKNNNAQRLWVTHEPVVVQLQLEKALAGLTLTAQ